LPATTRLATVPPCPTTVGEHDLPAVEARRHLVQLAAERSFAVSVGVADIDSYLAYLDEEMSSAGRGTSWRP
jgi:hypothetical protein